MFYSFKRFIKSPFARELSSSERNELKYLTRVFPFKVSHYVLDELIDWANRDHDPIYRLTFPRRDMLNDRHWLLLTGAQSLPEEREAVRLIRQELNPNPNGQLENIPRAGQREFPGIQHKYRETVLFFPAQGQTCHSYCTYCFRWAQFVNVEGHKFRSNDRKDLYDYLRVHPEVTDVLFTGGDPMFMSNEQFLNYFNVILRPELDHIINIRIGSKALSFYPHRFLGSEGAELLAGLAKAVEKGKNVHLMAHFSHPRELETGKVNRAVRALRNAGINIRTQAPLVAGINDTAEIWRDMWVESVRMGMVPYYMFVERETGAHEYFSVSLAKAYQIFTKAYAEVTGLAKTVRGPSMSARPGKILVSGITQIGDKKKFVLKFIQARNPKLINKPFFAEYNDQATWVTDLEVDPPYDIFINRPQEAWQIGVVA